MPKWTKEQESAIKECGSNIIVSAGAGSGKTAVLSERVIYKLESGIHVDELLILTFTRAAAEEMKDRIRRKIAANEKYKDELDRLESSYITTFDSFALSVLKKYHYLLNLPSNIGVAEETLISLEKQKIMDEVFNTFYESEDPLFTELITKYSLKNDTIIKNAILELSDKIGNFINRDEYLQFLKDEFYKDENLDKLISEFQKFVDSKKHALSLELQNAYYYFDEDYNKKLDEVLLPIINADSLTTIASYKSAKLPTLKRGTDEEAKSVKDQVKAALNDLMSLTEFGTPEEIKSDLLKTKNTTFGVVKILEEFYRRLDEYKSSNNLYTFTDIASLAIKILKTNEPARLELKNKFKEIMIDEYQDTNDVQETFISLIASNNVYMVGDIKQSIYRFRGSNPKIFKDKYDDYSQGLNGRKIDLIKNFRSRSEVLNNINKIFDLLMDDNLGGARYTESHEMVYGNTLYDEKVFSGYNYNLQVLEYVPFENREFTNIEIEIFSIAQDIKHKVNSNFQVFDKETSEMRPFKYSDAVIILDRSKYFDDFKSIFEYLGIPLTILKDDRLNASSDFNLIKSLIDLLIRIKNKDYSSDFKYDIMSVGRSFLYEYTDQELFTAITSNNYRELSLYQDLNSIDDYNSKTISELLNDILDSTNFYNKIYKIGEYQNTILRIDKILELATTLGKQGLNIEQFRDYLTEIIDTELEIKYTSFKEDTDSVKILTIHKSKGLEYPICYFADLDHAFNTKELKNKFIASLDYGLISAIETEDKDQTDSILKILYKSSFLKDEIGEKIRLFYVALTRAREQMIIVLPKKDTHKLEKNEAGTIEEIRRLNFKSLGDFIYGIEYYLSDYLKNIDTSSIGLTKDYLYTKTSQKKELTSTNDDFVVQELNLESEEIEEHTFSKVTSVLIDKPTKENMEFGTLMHETLEYADFKNFDKDKIPNKFIGGKIEKFLKNPLLENIKNANIYKEYEFVYEDEENTYHGIIDLMLEYDDKIDIIDYKLKNTVDEHYKDQLAGYKKYISSVSNKPVKTYLYSIINETITEIN